MNNWKNHFEPLMPFIGIVSLALLLFFGSGCSSSELKHEPAKPVVNLYGVGQLYEEGKMIDCPGVHCESFAGSRKNCESGEPHSYTGYRQIHSIPYGYMGQGKPFDLGSFLRSKGITTVNTPPVDTVGLTAPRSRAGTGDVTDHFYGDNKQSAETKSTTADSGPFGWDIPSLDPDLLTWVLFLIGLALLLMLLRWLWRNLLGSGLRSEDRARLNLIDSNVQALRNDVANGFARLNSPRTPTPDTSVTSVTTSRGPETIDVTDGTIRLRMSADRIHHPIIVTSVNKEADGKETVRTLTVGAGKYQTPADAGSTPAASPAPTAPAQG